MNRVLLGYFKPGYNRRLLAKELADLKLDTPHNIARMHANAKHDAGILNLLVTFQYSSDPSSLLTNRNLQRVFDNAEYTASIVKIFIKLPSPLISLENFILLLQYKNFAAQIAVKISELLNFDNVTDQELDCYVKGLDLSQIQLLRIDQSKFETILQSYNAELNKEKIEIDLASKLKLWTLFRSKQIHNKELDGQIELNEFKSSL